MKLNTIARMAVVERFNFEYSLLLLFWHFGNFLAVWYPGTSVTRGTSATWWHTCHFVTLVAHMSLCGTHATAMGKTGTKSGSLGSTSNIADTAKL